MQFLQGDGEVAIVTLGAHPALGAVDPFQVGGLHEQELMRFARRAPNPESVGAVHTFPYPSDATIRQSRAVPWTDRRAQWLPPLLQLWCARPGEGEQKSALFNCLDLISYSACDPEVAGARSESPPLGPASEPAGAPAWFGCRGERLLRTPRGAFLPASRSRRRGSPAFWRAACHFALRVPRRLTMELLHVRTQVGCHLRGSYLSRGSLVAGCRGHRRILSFLLTLCHLYHSSHELPSRIERHCLHRRIALRFPSDSPRSTR